MKRSSMIFILIITILIMTTCGTEISDNEPRIDLKFNVTKLTDNEFRYVGTWGLENPIKEDFRNMEIVFNVKNLDKISNRKISVPDYYKLKKVINSYDRERYWYGGGSGRDNLSENFAEYSYEFVFYSKGLDEEAIKKIFNSMQVGISWITDSGKNEEQVFKLGESIQFQ